jgi:hypothetical protein
LPTIPDSETLQREMTEDNFAAGHKMTISSVLRESICRFVLNRTRRALQKKHKLPRRHFSFPPEPGDPEPVTLAGAPRIRNTRIALQTP